jgi:hypothetical protein
MVSQKELHDTLTGLLDQIGVGLDLHSRHDGESARGNGLGGLFNLNQAHSAVSGDGKTLVVTETRDVNASLITSLNNGRSSLDLVRLAIHENLNLVLDDSGGAEVAGG